MSVPQCVPKISAIRYSLGNTTPIADLRVTEGADPDTIESLAARGLDSFCCDDRSLQDMCLSCIADTLADAALVPADIDAIVLGPSTAEWSLLEERRFLAAFADMGFSRSSIMAVSMQACCVANAALDLARWLVVSSGAKAVLVVVFGKNCDGARIAPEATTLFSDGAVSCVVSSAHGQFELIATKSLTDPSLATLQWVGANFQQYLQSGVTSLRRVCQDVYAQAEIAPHDIAAVFGTNGSAVYLQMIGIVSGVPQHRVYKANLARYAHVYGCDNLIGLCDRTSVRKFDAQEYVLLVAWSPTVASACLLRRV